MANLESKTERARKKRIIKLFKQRVYMRNSLANSKKNSHISPFPSLWMWFSWLFIHLIATISAYFKKIFLICQTMPFPTYLPTKILSLPWLLAYYCINYNVFANSLYFFIWAFVNIYKQEEQLQCWN